MASADDKRKVLAHQRDLRANLTDILNDIENGNYAQLKNKFLSIEDGIKGFEDYLSTTIEAFDYAEHRAMDTVPAQKVFKIPELLELILENLDIPDVMRCYEVCRTMRDTIEASSKLQTQLCLLSASEDSAMRWPFQFKCFSCYSRLSPAKAGRTSAIMRTLPGSSTSLPTMGSRWKRMFIRQPPIHSMKVGMGCCLTNNSRLHNVNLGWQAWDIKSVKGLTIGDLYEMAERLLEEHPECWISTHSPAEEPENETDERHRNVYFDGPIEDLF